MSRERKLNLNIKCLTTAECQGVEKSGGEKREKHVNGVLFIVSWKAHKSVPFFRLFTRLCALKSYENSLLMNVSKIEIGARKKGENLFMFNSIA